MYHTNLSLTIPTYVTGVYITKLFSPKKEKKKKNCTTSKNLIERDHLIEVNYVNLN